MGRRRRLTFLVDCSCQASEHSLSEKKVALARCANAILYRYYCGNLHQEVERVAARSRCLDLLDLHGLGLAAKNWYVVKAREKIASLQ